MNWLRNLCLLIVVLVTFGAVAEAARKRVENGHIKVVNPTVKVIKKDTHQPQLDVRRRPGKRFPGVVALLGHVSTYPVEKVLLSPESIVDLSYPFNEQTVYFPQKKGRNDFQLTLHETVNRQGVHARQGHFQGAEHGGTHLDSPAHFGRNGTHMADLTVEQLVGPAVVINISAQVAANPDYGLSVADVAAFEAQHGRIPAGAFVFINSAWGRRWPDRRQIFGTGGEDFRNFSQAHFPGFAPAATQFLIAERQIRGLASDGPSVDPAPELRGGLGTHVQLAAHGKLGIEYTAHVERLPPTGAKVIIAPMKNRHGSGAPTRIFAILPRR